MTRPKKQVKLSEGIRLRLTHDGIPAPVYDADDAIYLYLPPSFVKAAAHRRREYDIDEPQNFLFCAASSFIGPALSCEALFMRRFAFLKREGENHWLRYQQDAACRRVVQLNDRNRYEEIEPNVRIGLLPPSPGRRLDRQRGPRVSKKSRGLRKNPARPHPDPLKGIIRNGVHAEVTG